MVATPEDSRLPEESESQEIGQQAVLAFEIHRPRNWRLKRMDGDDDFGIDMQVQVTDNSRVVGLFHAQIKGSKRGRLSADGSYYAVPLKTKTLNYYARIQDPIILVFADLSSGEDPRDCPLFWTWISEDLHEFLDADTDFASYSQDSFTFKVSATNVLSPSLDVLPDLQRFRRRANALRGFYQSIEWSIGPNQSTMDTVGALTSTIRTGGASLIAALTTPQRSPWIEPQPGTLAATLLKAHQHIADHHEVAARKILEEIQERITSGSAHERAEYAFLSGKCLILEGNDEAAIDHLRQAYELYAEPPRYLAAFLEAQFKYAHRGPEAGSAVQALMTDFPISDDPKIIAIKAKIYAAAGAYDEATQLLSTVEPKDAVVTQGLIAYLKRDWHGTISCCHEGMPLLGESKTDQMILHVLKARALFHLAVNDSTLPPDAQMPFWGLPQINMPTLKDAWDEMQVALTLLRESDWPPNAEYLMDVLGATSVILGQHREILGDLRALSKRRPHLTVVHEQLYRLALLAGEHALALEALDKACDAGDVVHFRILTLYEHNRYKDALDYAKEHLLTADPHHQLHALCLGIVALCAEQVVRPDEASPFLAQLRSRAEWVGEQAVYDFISMCNATPLRRDEALSAFIACYRENPESAIIQENLFASLNLHDRGQAELCREVGERLRSRRRLPVPEVGHLAQALVTLSDWPSVISLVDDAIAQYGDVPKLLAMQAVAVEGLGDTSHALKILTQLVASQPEEDLAINAYVNICVRNGFHRQALEQLEHLLERANSRDVQLAYLQQIFTVLGSLDPISSRLQEIAWRYGQLVDQTIEEQEGVFLQMLIVATLSDRVSLHEARRDEFCQRGEAFFQRFPQSKILRRFAVPNNSTAEDLKRALSEVLGLTPERELWFRNVEDQLQRGELAAPFCWRPKRLLLHVADVVHLWHMAKHSAKDAHAYHLTISGEANYEERELPRGLDRPPLIDLISLLVLHDLNLLELVFKIFPTIAISKGTLLDIQRLTGPVPWGYPQVAEIRDLLKTHLAQIWQPESAMARRQAQESSLDQSLEEMKALVGSGSFALYTDDVCARVYVSLHSDTMLTVTTLDILAEAERRGWLSVAQVSAKLALLAKWNVGIPIKMRYFLAAIPLSVEGITNLEELIALLDSDEVFGEFTKAVWNFRQNYLKIFKHAVTIIAYVAQNDRAAVELLAAIWAVWLGKVQLRTDVPGSQTMHLARSLIHASDMAQENTVAVKRLWDAYIILIIRIYGTYMNSQREREARQVVGKYAAQIVYRNEVENLGDKIFQVLSSGLINGTSEYDLFCKGYESERIRLFRQKDKYGP